MCDSMLAATEDIKPSGLKCMTASAFTLAPVNPARTDKPPAIDFVTAPAGARRGLTAACTFAPCRPERLAIRSGADPGKAQFRCHPDRADKWLRSPHDRWRLPAKSLPLAIA